MLGLRTLVTEVLLFPLLSFARGEEVPDVGLRLLPVETGVDFISFVYTPHWMLSFCCIAYIMCIWMASFFFLKEINLFLYTFSEVISLVCLIESRCILPGFAR